MCSGDEAVDVAGLLEKEVNTYDRKTQGPHAYILCRQMLTQGESHFLLPVWFSGDLATSFPFHPTVLTLPNFMAELEYFALYDVCHSPWCGHLWLLTR